MRNRCQSENGFTMVEVLVSISVISILIALTLPAVQSARESARKVHCANNLHQLGIAIHGYHSLHDVFPITSTHDLNKAPYYGGFYSIHTRLLPFLDQTPLYNAINYEVGAWVFSPLVGEPGFSWQNAANAVNATARQTTIATFLCPSESSPLVNSGTTYRGSQGVGPAFLQQFEHPDSGNGIFSMFGPVRMAQVSDGLSHTAAMSEKVIGSGRPERLDPFRDAYRMVEAAYTADDLLLACRLSARTDPERPGFAIGGDSWFFSGMEMTGYNHAQKPNGPIPDCFIGSRTLIGMATARSYHLGGVHLLMADGATRFVVETIDQQVWRGLGTRNGREIIE
ncbi:DUF1559 domain-containing protein [soil metagenome]